MRGVKKNRTDKWIELNKTWADSRKQFIQSKGCKTKTDQT